jgi:hypothetical protein
MNARAAAKPMPLLPPVISTALLVKLVDGGCMTVIEEVGKGEEDPAHRRDTDQNLRHRGHALWRATLRWMSESVGG